MSTSRLRLPRPGRPHDSSAGSRGTRATAQLAVAAVAVAGSALTTAVPSSAAPSPSPATAPPTLVVNASQPFRPVTHVASGGLYGLDTATIPADSLVEPLHPNTFVQMAPGGKQLPNGEPAPGGDALAVAPEAARAGANVVVRMPDWYPNFPYRWVSWSDWLSAVDTQVKAVLAAGDSNISAFELWNEPDWTWNTSAAGDFNDGWTRTFNEVRSLDPGAVIQGPSYSDNISGMQSFLASAVATNTVPDIISWHELQSSGKIAGDVATVTNIEKSLGITPRPIAIEEYAAPGQVGIPGDLVGYIAQFERLGISNAELAFWNHYGTLGDLLTDTGAKPNGAYWLYRWYGAMTGHMVTVVPPGTPGTGLDGAASVNAARDQVGVIFGGASGATAVRVNGLDALKLGRRVKVKLEYTPSAGRTTAVPGPVTISDTTYPVHDGTITVPVAMNPTYGYHLVITPRDHGPATSLAGTYTIRNAGSGLALDTQNGGTAPGTLADQASGGDKTGSWRLVRAGAGLYKIMNTRTGLLLGISGDATDKGANALIAGHAPTPGRLWQLIPDGAGRYEIANYNSGLVLGVTSASTAPGALVVQWPDGVPTSSGADGPRVPGKIGNAVGLSGNGDYVSLPPGVVSGLNGDFTVSAWVNPAQDTTWSRVFDFGTGTTDYMFLTVNDGSEIRFAITTGGGGAEQQIKGTGVLPLNAWSLVAVTVSGTTGTLYVNGTAVGTNPDVTLHPSSLGATTQNWVGRSEYAGDPYLSATVDDLNIYSRALSPAEVAALAAGQPGAGDVADYTFDETGGATAADASGNGRDATVLSGQSPLNFGNSALNDHWWTLTASS
jgi:concanavalin A-like lectin/glucanase superfamily protein/ricin-type beta-trefoil lectin protein